MKQERKDWRTDRKYREELEDILEKFFTNRQYDHYRSNGGGWGYDREILRIFLEVMPSQANTIAQLGNGYFSIGIQIIIEFFFKFIMEHQAGQQSCNWRTEFINYWYERKYPEKVKYTIIKRTKQVIKLEPSNEEFYERLKEWVKWVEFIKNNCYDTAFNFAEEIKHWTDVQEQLKQNKES